MFVQQVGKLESILRCPICIDSIEAIRRNWFVNYFSHMFYPSLYSHRMAICKYGLLGMTQRMILYWKFLDSFILLNLVLISKLLYQEFLLYDDNSFTCWYSDTGIKYPIFKVFSNVYYVLIPPFVIITVTWTTPSIRTKPAIEVSHYLIISPYFRRIFFNLLWENSFVDEFITGTNLIYTLR